MHDAGALFEHSDAHSVIVHSINYCPKVALASSGVFEFSLDTAQGIFFGSDRQLD